MMEQRIILISNNETIILKIVDLICDEYNVTETDSTENAILLVKKYRMEVSAIIVDCTDEFGYPHKTIERLRFRTEMGHMPIVAIISADDSDSEKRMLAAGADDIILLNSSKLMLLHRLGNMIVYKESLKLAKAAKRDIVTGLYTKEAFLERAEEMIHLQTPGYYVMSCIDISEFKHINEKYGNKKGDEVLNYIADLFHENFVRMGGICCRIMADNFAVLYPSSLLNTETLKTIHNKLSNPCENISSISFYIGRYIAEDISISPNSMLERASIAKTLVKKNRGNSIAVYDDNMRREILRRQELVYEMKPALKKGQFEVWFQLQYNHDNGQINGSEALVRWNHPKNGLMMPEEFIEIFETDGLIYEMDKYVWRQVCRYLKKWINSGIPKYPVSVNISGYDLIHDDIVENLTGLIKEYDIPMSLIHLEITESAFENKDDKILETVRNLKRAGFIIAIDDFGSGYATLVTLNKVPADIVKLDVRSFECGDGDVRSGNIIESIVRMTKWLGIEVIAEGVETEEQADYMKSIGCSCIQGFLYARPVKADEYEKELISCGQKTILSSKREFTLLTNDDFWDPKSIETMIFNSYVGGASVFEFYKNHIEVLRVNEKFAKLLGGENMTMEQARRTDWFDFIEDNATKENMIETLNEAIRTGREVRNEVKLTGLRKQGESFYLRAIMKVLSSIEDRYLVYCLIEDVTAQKEAEEEKRRAERYQISLLENIPCGAGIYEYSEKGIHAVYINNHYWELIGRKPGNYQTDNIFDVVRESDRELLARMIKSGLTRNEKIECDIYILHGCGEYRPFRLVGNFIKKAENTYLIYNTYTPITEGELNLKALLPVMLEAMLSSSADAAYFKDRNLSYICCSKAYAGMVGEKSEKDLIGKNDYDLFDKEYADRYFTSDKRLMETGESIIDYIESIPSKDGEARYSSISKYVLKDSSGMVIGLYGIGRDVTEKRETYARLKMLTDSIPGGIVMYEISPLGTRTLYVSDGMSIITGYEREEYIELTQNNAFLLVNKADLPFLRSQIENMLKSNTPIDCMYRITARNGESRWINIRARTSDKYGDRVIVNAVLFDITEQKRTEQKLRASYRAMEVASQNGGVSFWAYDIEKKKAYYNISDSEYGHENLKVVENVPDCMIGKGYIAREDEGIYLDMYGRLFSGAKKSECTIRVRNSLTSDFEWQHIIYLLNEDKSCETTEAIGFSFNANLEQENRQRYEHELRLRHELIKNSVIYCQLNLTKNVLEEYYSQFDNVCQIDKNIIITREVTGRLLSNIAPEDSDRVYNTIFSDALRKAYTKGISSTSIVYRRRTPDNGIRWIEAYVSIMEKPDTEDVIAFVHSQDIDVEKKNQLAIESIMNEEFETVSVLNVSRGFVRIVQSALKSEESDLKQEFDFDKYYSRLVRDQVVDEDKNLYENFYNIARLVKILELENEAKVSFRILGSDQVIHRKRARAYYLDNTKTDIVFIRRDITDLYEEEQKQKKILQDAINAANAANRSKSEFLSHMSHDMRTPLNAVLSFSDNEILRDLSEKQLREYLDKIHVSGNYLLGIINDVLDMSKIEQREVVLKPEPYLLDEFVEMINNIIKELCKKKSIEFVMNIERVVVHSIFVDKIRFNQIFINLLSNAVKFTPANGTIEFIIEKYYEKKENIIRKRFIVRDNGIGMSKDFIPYAFDSFKQEYRKDVADRIQGTGLGLAIVKEIVTLMKGTITVESSPGKGSEFVVDLPLAIADAVDEEEFEIDYNDLNNMHILLGEDNEINTEIAVSFLEAKGCIVDCAANGKEVLDRFVESEEGFYDAILMDIRMPIMNGIESTIAIRNTERGDSKIISIAAMTADAFMEDKLSAQQAGMNGYLSKPIVPRELYKLLCDIAKNKKRFHENDIQILQAESGIT